MRRRYALLGPLLLFVAGSCASEAPATVTAPSGSIAPASPSTHPTASRTPAPLAIPTDEATLAGVTFVFGNGVGDADRTVMREGVALAKQYARATFGGDIPGTETLTAFASRTAGSMPPWGRGCCAAYLREVVFDVDEAGWAGQRPWPARIDHLKSVVHEYIHDWQYTAGGAPYGCIGAATTTERLTPNWFVEGMAEYAGYDAVVGAGLLTREAADAFQRDGLSRGVSPYPVSALEQSWPSSGMPYAVAYMAVKMIADVAGGAPSLASLCRDVASGAPWPTAFAKIAGITISAFYTRFEAARPPSSSPGLSAPPLGRRDQSVCDGVVQRADVTCLGRLDRGGTALLEYQFTARIGALESLPRDQMRLVSDCAALVDFAVANTTVSLLVARSAAPETCQVTLVSANRSLPFSMPMAFVHR